MNSLAINLASAGRRCLNIRWISTSPLQLSKSVASDPLADLDGEKIDSPSSDSDKEDMPTNTRFGEKYVNRISLLGRVGKTPESFGEAGKEVTVFPLLTKSNHRDKNGFRNEKHWHKIMVTNKLRGQRQFVQNNVNTGDTVMVSGSIAYRNIKDEDGHFRSITTIVSESVIQASRGSHDD